MEKIVDDDDEFGDLYADVEVQAINAIMQSTTTPEVNEVNEENAIYEEECESESDEDDLNIVLNDDYENDKFEENEVKQNSNGSENSTGEKNVYKYTRPPQAAYSNHHKADGSSCAHSYSAAQNGQTFSLPWSRNILDINIDIFEKKPWRHPSADLTDYFNFGFDEDSWKQYCNLLDKHREQAERVVKESDYKPSKNSKPKGRVIEVEESITERQPSTDVGRSQDRDSGVVIQITLQDSMEDFINSPKGQCRASENRDAGEDGRDFLTSISEDELPSLEGTEGGSGSATNGRNTPVQECVSMDSDNYENCDFSDAEEHDHQEGADCDVDQTLGAIESSHDANTSSEGDISDPRKFVMLQEPLHGEGGEHSPGSSCSQSHGEASGDGALLDFERSRDHHVRSLPNSESALREKGTIDYKPLKFPKTHHIRTKPGGSKYFTRGRSVQRDLPHDRTRPGRMSETNPAHLQDEDSRTSDARIVYERCNSTAIQHRKDSRHAFDSHEKEDTSHFNGAERFYSDAVRLSDYPRWVSYTKNRETECQLKRRFEKSWCGSRSTKSKLDPLELSISRDDELWERDRPHSGSRLTVQDMDNVAIHESEQLIDKNTPYLDDEKASPQMWKPNQLKSNKRMRTDDLVTECNYIYDIMEETDNKYRPYNTDTDILEDGCHVNLTYFRRETKSHIKGKRRDNSPRYGLNNICSMDLKNEEGRFDGYRPPSFRLYREPCTASRKWQNPSLPRGNRRRIFSGTGRCQDGGRFANLTNSISANQTIKYPGNQDSFERRKEYQQSEGLRCVEDENSSWFQQNILDAERISCSFKRTPTDRRFESFDSEHGPNLVGKLLDGRHMDQERYKLMREGNNASQFGQGSKFFHRDNHQRRFSRWRGSVDPGLVVGKRESSGRWSKAGGVEGINEPHLRKTLKTRDLASDSNENGIERLDRFADAQQEESPDIEEGQIISEEMNKKTIKGRISYSGKLQTREMKSLDNDKKVEGQDNPKILEIMAKMEKRRERFKQSIALNNESKVVSKPSVDLFAGTTEAMQPRPARKRRWVGSETN